jgi:two-component system, OmpR family, catabolic regulation response regulator CreB
VNAGLQVNVTAGLAQFGGQALPLTRLELLLLDKLLAARGRVLSRDALLQSVWDLQANSALTERTVDTHVKTLRAKLREAGASAELIETVRGLGYCVR